MEKRRKETFSGQSGAMEILSYLGKQNRNIILSDIMHDCQLNSQTATRAIICLKELQLINEKRGDYNRRLIFLTPKGEKIAKLTEQIDVIMNEK
jgi:DNA-binding MarR family transcriptional regulator